MIDILNFKIEDFERNPCMEEWDKYINAKTDSEKATIVLLNFDRVYSSLSGEYYAIEIVKECVRLGANVNAKYEGDKRESVLDIAEWFGDKEIIDYLIKNGAKKL